MELYFEVFCPRNGGAALQRLQGVGLVFFARSPDRGGGGREINSLGLLLPVVDLLVRVRVDCFAPN